ncbi:SagB-type dehydrogenase family enzyme [Saccharothrix ecbatanensis]|uniref:SagB-type dehydrogenase family enzyme n=1 Tax=Saccharothrix ecbatanensis TaxID=1105145 RepID=A0A7W9M2S7_9PSEU|nr:SagB family peptide dehydrogenase [Saccharothrix ecbatanensis]MBB5805287.1 SagB-type dehydrogenase family enzyme [Saccharothrix ecbatanensis]
MAEPTRPDDVLLTLATRTNSYRAVTPAFTSTAFRSPIDRYGHLDFCGPPQVAEEFLISTRLDRHDREVPHAVGEYLDERFVPVVALVDTEDVPVPDRVELPPSVELRAPLGRVIGDRRSARAFGGGAVPFGELATLVRAAAGVTREPDGERMPGRAAPSGGGLYPVELWVLALDVTDLARGVYRYAPRLDVFERCHDERVVEDFLTEGLIDVGDEDPSRGAAAIVALVARPWRSMRKYGPRGLRLVLHEVGAMSEHLHLAGTALGLASTDWSSFYDGPANRCLGLDGLRHVLLHTVLVGRPHTRAE